MLSRVTRTIGWLVVGAFVSLILAVLLAALTKIEFGTCFTLLYSVIVLWILEGWLRAPLAAIRTSLRTPIRIVGGIALFFGLWFMLGHLLQIPPITGYDAWAEGRGADRMFWAHFVPRGAMTTIVLLGIIVFMIVWGRRRGSLGLLAKIIAVLAIVFIVIAVTLPRLTAVLPTVKDAGDKAITKKVLFIAGEEDPNHDFWADRTCSESYERNKNSPIDYSKEDPNQPVKVEKALIPEGCYSQDVTLPDGMADGFGIYPITPVEHPENWVVNFRVVTKNGNVLAPIEGYTKGKKLFIPFSELPMTLRIKAKLVEGGGVQFVHELHKPE